MVQTCAALSLFIGSLLNVSLPRFFVERRNYQTGIAPECFRRVHLLSPDLSGKLFLIAGLPPAFRVQRMSPRLGSDHRIVRDPVPGSGSAALGTYGG